MIRKLYLIAILFHFLITSFTEAKGHIYTDEIGRKVKIPDVPKRIISLAPSITEILFALGLNDEIVGVTHFCDYPEAALKKPKIGGFINPSIEKIVSIKPDLIIGTKDGNPMEIIHRLSGLGFSVFLTDSKSFDGVIRTIGNIGEIVGRQYESRRITRDMIRRKEYVLARTRSLPKPKVFFQVGYAFIITVGRGTLGDDLIHLAGGNSISEHESLNYPIYSIEAIILKAPEIIITSSMENKMDRLNLVKTWQKWKSIPAVKMNAIYVIDSNLVDRPSPRIIEGLEAMAKMIHPKDFGGR